MFRPHPVEGHISSVLEDIVIRVSHNPDVFMPWLAFRDKIHQGFLRMLAVAGERSGYLTIPLRQESDHVCNF